MLLLATGSLLVMIDLDSREGRVAPTNGLFRAFKSATTLGAPLFAFFCCLFFSFCMNRPCELRLFFIDEFFLTCFN